MSKSEVAEWSARLAALWESEVGQAKTARLQDVRRDVEEAMRGCVTRVAMIRELAATGFECRPQTFALTLVRLRKKLRTLSRPPVANANGPSTPGHALELPAQQRALDDTSCLIRASMPSLPTNWRTAKLTLEQKLSLTSRQRKERRKARCTLDETLCLLVREVQVTCASNIGVASSS